MTPVTNFIHMECVSGNIEETHYWMRAHLACYGQVAGGSRGGWGREGES